MDKVIEGKMPAPRILIAASIILIIAAGIGGYILGSSTAPAKAPTTTWTPPTNIKAAWIYVGPIGDYGWSYAHDLGRRVVEALFRDWLETTYMDWVSETQLQSVIDRLVAQGYNVIFTTSFEFMDGTIEAAKRYPNVLFFHCSGYKRAPNVGTYFADLYQVYYLNGLMAGALTKTGKIGYIAAFTIPEVVRHINAFAIGAKEVGEQLGKNITVYVVELGAWVAPDKAKEVARYLVEELGVDVLAFTEDTTATVEWAKEYYKATGKLVYVFSHYSPMYEYGPDVVVSGQLVRWEVIYADILVKIKSGVLNPNNLENVDFWYLLSTGAVELGAHVYPNGSVMYINPKFVDELKSIYVVDKLTGARMSVYDLVMERYWQMKNAPMLQPLQFSALSHRYENITFINIGGKEGTYPVAPIFDPFTGPLTGYCLYGGEQATSAYCRGRSPGSGVVIPSGVRLGHEDLWTMDWFVSWVEYLGGK